jgi:hypothetical protein
MERRLISFEELRENCGLNVDCVCVHPDNDGYGDITCSRDTCSIWARLEGTTRTVSVSRLVEIRQLLDTMCARDGADSATLVRDWLDEVIGGDDEEKA